MGSIPVSVISFMSFRAGASKGMKDKEMDGEGDTSPTWYLT